MNQLTKKRIINVVLAYKKLFPHEYELAVKQNKMRADMQLTPWGEVPNESAIGRESFRIPENLQIAFQHKLTDEQYDWLFTEVPGGTPWFQRTFPEFVPNHKTE